MTTRIEAFQNIERGDVLILKKSLLDCLPNNGSLFGKTPYVIQSKESDEFGDGILHLSLWNEVKPRFKIKFNKLQSNDCDIYRKRESEKGESYLVLNALSHMDLDTLLLMKNDYYSGTVKVHEIKQKYPLGTTPPNRAIPLPIKKAKKDGECARCGDRTLLKTSFKRKNSRLQGFFISECEVCCGCGHILNLQDPDECETCSCRECSRMTAEKRAKKDEAEKAVINEFFGRHIHQPVLLKDISLKGLVLLYAFIMGDNNKTCSELHFNDFAATRGDSIQAVNFLCEHNIIIVDPCSNRTAFLFDEYSEGDETLSYYVHNVRYLLNIKSDAEGEGDIEDNILLLTGMEELLPKIIQERVVANEDEMKAMWLDIATSECRQYCNQLLADNFFTYESSEKLTYAITVSLMDFSQANVYYFLFMSVKSCVDTVRRFPSLHKDPYKLITDRLFDYKKRALIEKWKVKEYNRHIKLPQSLLSTLFFDEFMGGTRRAFHSSINAFTHPMLANKDEDASPTTVNSDPYLDVDICMAILQKHADKFAAFNNGMTNSAQDALDEIRRLEC